MAVKQKDGFDWKCCRWLEIGLKPDSDALRQAGRDPHAYRCKDRRYKVGSYDLCDKLYCINEAREKLPDGQTVGRPDIEAPPGVTDGSTRSSAGGPS